MPIFLYPDSNNIERSYDCFTKNHFQIMFYVMSSISIFVMLAIICTGMYYANLYQEKISNNTEQHKAETIETIEIAEEKIEQLIEVPIILPTLIASGNEMFESFIVVMKIEPTTKQDVKYLSDNIPNLTRLLSSTPTIRRVEIIEIKGASNNEIYKINNY
jgi:hypothetical protein